MLSRCFVMLVMAGVCVLAAPSIATASDPSGTSGTAGDYEPGAVAPAFTPGDDEGVGFPNVPTTELPFTGVPIVVFALIGVVLVSVGLLLKHNVTKE